MRFIYGFNWESPEKEMRRNWTISCPSDLSRICLKDRDLWEVETRLGLGVSFHLAQALVIKEENDYYDPRVEVLATKVLMYTNDQCYEAIINDSDEEIFPGFTNNPEMISYLRGLVLQLTGLWFRGRS